MDRVSLIIELILFWSCRICRVFCLLLIIVVAIYELLVAVGVIPPESMLNMLLVVWSSMVPKMPEPFYPYGRCPPPRTHCKPDSTPCTSNEDCVTEDSSSFICCKSACGSVCFDPLYYSGLVCPAPEAATCEKPTRSCKMDSDCKGKICCNIPKCGGSVCTKPFDLGLRGRCAPQHPPQPCPIIQTKCKSNEECGTDVCCDTLCGRICTEPFVKDFVCPPAFYECTAKTNSKRCNVDRQCAPGLELCCNITDCGGFVCIAGVYTGIQGRCFSMYDDCPEEYDECNAQYDCDEDKICCLREKCGKICVIPNDSGFLCPPMDEECPPDEPMPCDTDQDCLDNYICCNFTGCGYICVNPFMITGYCPALRIQCTEPPHPCNFAADCPEHQVCCKSIHCGDEYVRAGGGAMNCFEPVPYHLIPLHGNWTPWSNWSTCFGGGCSYKKNRTCLPEWANCQGESVMLYGCSLSLKASCLATNLATAGIMGTINVVTGIGGAVLGGLGGALGGAGGLFSGPPEVVEPPTRKYTKRPKVPRLPKMTMPRGHG